MFIFTQVHKKYEEQRMYEMWVGPKHADDADGADDAGDAYM